MTGSPATRAKALLLIDYLATIPDPRVVGRTSYRLVDLLVTTILAFLSGAEDFVEVEIFAHGRRRWLRRFADFGKTIPSHDTFDRVFRLVDPKALSQRLSEWLIAVSKAISGDTIAIDGKTSRHSFDTASGLRSLHMVTAWATEARLVLGNTAVREKSNEITAIPDLLELIDIKDCIVTIDAMGCQRKIAQLIIERKGNYIFGLKGNQPEMEREVREFFEHAESTRWKDIPHSEWTSTDAGHGRIETRRVVCTSDVKWFEDRLKWAGLRCFGYVESVRTNKATGKTSTERRYFISSLDGTDAKRFGTAIRSHWGIENELHWVLDVQYREDDSRARKDNSAANMAIIRRFLVSLVKKDKSTKRSGKGKRKMAGWDPNYLTKLLALVAVE